jgi:hypothetical protein
MGDKQSVKVIELMRAIAQLNKVKLDFDERAVVERVAAHTTNEVLIMNRSDDILYWVLGPILWVVVMAIFLCAFLARADSVNITNPDEVIEVHRPYQIDILNECALRESLNCSYDPDLRRFPTVPMCCVFPDQDDLDSEEPDICAYALAVLLLRDRELKP